MATNHDRVGKALELLKAGLAPFVERKIKGAIESRRLNAHKLRGYVEDPRLADSSSPTDSWATGCLTTTAVTRNVSMAWMGQQVFIRSLK